MILKDIGAKDEFQMIDICKFIMAFVVIAIHTNPLENSQSKWAAELFMAVSGWAVPFFFITSGFFLKEHKLRKYLVKIIEMYCAWTLISFPLTVYGYVLSGNDIMSCVLSYVKYFLFVGKLYNSYHLSYLLAIIYSLIIIELLIRLNKREWLLGAAFVIYSINMFMQYAENYIGNTGSIINKIVYIYQFIFNKGGIFSGMIYMVIGMIIARKRVILNKTCCIFGIIICEILKTYLGEAADNYILIAESALFFQIIVGVSLPKLDYAVYMRKLSTIIYLVHLIVFSVYTIVIIKQPNVLGVKSFLVTAVFSLAISVIIRKLEQTSRFKWLTNITG